MRIMQLVFRVTSISGLILHLGYSASHWLPKPGVKWTFLLMYGVSSIETHGALAEGGAEGTNSKAVELMQWKLERLTG